MFVLTGRTAAWKANCIYGEPSAEAVRGKRRKHDKFLYIPIFWYVAIIIFKQTSTSLGQRESSSGGNGDSASRQTQWWAEFLERPSFFFFPRVWKISVSGTRELECKEGENQILGTGIWPYDRAAVWEPMLYTVGFHAFTWSGRSDWEWCGSISGAVMCIVGSRGHFILH